MAEPESTARATAQADECPFQRPFPADFSECPAYLPSEFVGLNLQYLPLPPVWTCQNLVVAQRAGRPGAHYGRCRLGTEEDRLRWVRRLESERLTGLVEVRREFNREFHELVLRLWAAKGRVLRSPGDDSLRLSLNAVTEEFKTSCDAFFDDRAGILSEVGLPLGATKRLVRELVDRLVASRTSDNAMALTEEDLAQFPPSLRFFLQPDAKPDEDKRPDDQR